MATKKTTGSGTKKTGKVAQRQGSVPSNSVFVPMGSLGLAYPMQPSTKHAGRTKFGRTKDHKKNPTTAAQVEALASVGHTINEIACALDLRPGQIKQYYLEEFERAPVAANYRVAINVLAAAQGREVGTGKTKGVVFDKDLAKFWLNNRAGFKSGQAIELTGKDGAPLQQAARVNVYVPQHPRRVAPRKGEAPK